jgi:hypothetical protein
MSDLDRFAGFAADAISFRPSRSGRTPLTAIEQIAQDIAGKAPMAVGEAAAILALVGEVRAAGPQRDEIIEAIEDVCGDDLSGCCLSRIAEAVMKVCAVR